MENRAHALVAGLFVLVFTLAVAAAVWWFGGTRDVTRDIVLVTQRNVNGLNPLAQVRYRGMTAGKVISISLDPQDKRNILVLVRVDAGLPLTRATTAQLNSQGITGLSYVQLEDDGASVELLPVNDENPPRVALRQTLFESIGDRANEIVGKVATLADNLNRVLDERNLHSLGRTLENVSVASEGLRQVPVVMASVQAVLSADNLTRLQKILSHLERTAGEAAPMTREMRELIVSMQALSKRLDSMVVQVGGELTGSTLPRFDVLVDELATNSRQLQRILEELEVAPQSLLLGLPSQPSGPGESGYVHSGK